jgi:hypothetical protein
MLRQRRIREDLVESDALPVAGERDKHQASGRPLPCATAESFLIMTGHAVLILNNGKKS